MKNSMHAEQIGAAQCAAGLLIGMLIGWIT